MTPEQAGALIGLAVYFGMRLIDRLLPDGYHLSFLERWLKPNKETDDEK